MEGKEGEKGGEGTTEREREREYNGLKEVPRKGISWERLAV